MTVMKFGIDGVKDTAWIAGVFSLWLIRIRCAPCCPLQAKRRHCTYLVGAKKPLVRDGADFFVGFFYSVMSGAPDRIRTCDQRLRKPLLYPAELRVLEGQSKIKFYVAASSSSGYALQLLLSLRSSPAKQQVVCHSSALKATL